MSGIIGLWVEKVWFRVGKSGGLWVGKNVCGSISRVFCGEVFTQQ